MSSSTCLDNRPTLGIFSFTGCEGCQTTILLIEDVLELLSRFDVQYFDLVRDKNREASFDLGLVEGAITSEREIAKLEKIRRKTGVLVAIGACACHGGIPSMRNRLERDELTRYVYSQKMLADAIDAAPISDFITVDYHMYGCPILRHEVIEVTEGFLSGTMPSECQEAVCHQCGRRGKRCLLREQRPCLGAATRGGCRAPCPARNIPCFMCRGPLSESNFAREIKMFRRFGLSEKQIENRLQTFRRVGR